MQERAILISENEIFKLDPHKSYQRKKSPLQLSQVQGVGISCNRDQGVVVRFQNGNDLVLYLMCPHSESRVVELVAILCQICQRYQNCCFNREEGRLFVCGLVAVSVWVWFGCCGCLYSWQLQVCYDDNVY